MPRAQQEKVDIYVARILGWIRERVRGRKRAAERVSALPSRGHAPRIVPMCEPVHETVLNIPYRCLVIPNVLQCKLEKHVQRLEYVRQSEVRRSEVDKASQDTKDSD